MKLTYIVAVCLAVCLPAVGGESALTRTFQPVDGLGAGVVRIIPVVCWDWYAMSGQPTAIPLITAPNKPPTNAPEAITDWNLASRSGIRLTVGDFDQNPSVILDATGFNAEHTGGYPKEDVVRATLECLRRVLPEKHRKIRVTLRVSESDSHWVRPIVEKFNTSDRSKAFYAPLP